MFHYLKRKQYCLRTVKDCGNPTNCHKHRRPEKATWKSKLFTSQFSEPFIKDKITQFYKWECWFGWSSVVLTISLTGWSSCLSLPTQPRIYSVLGLNGNILDTLHSWKIIVATGKEKKRKLKAQWSVFQRYSNWYCCADHKTPCYLQKCNKIFHFFFSLFFFSPVNTNQLCLM